jgi:hypothetical protein
LLGQLSVASVAICEAEPDSMSILDGKIDPYLNNRHGEGKDYALVHTTVTGIF